VGAHVIDRSNLTILLAPGFRDLPEFLAAHRVEVVASLPCYLEENTDAQRGDGVFARSIEALLRLNALGYGRPGSGLDLTLVYNPLGASLPPDQAALEAAYRRELEGRYGIAFTRLYTITNMPISRFLEDLVRAGRLDAYMRTLVDAFNPLAVPQAPGSEAPADGEPRRPVQEFRLGRVKAAVWANETQLGTRYSVTIVWLFKLDGETAWRTSTAFNRDDLPLVAKVADLAHTHIFGLVQNDTPF